MPLPELKIKFEEIVVPDVPYVDHTEKDFIPTVVVPPRPNNYQCFAQFVCYAFFCCWCFPSYALYNSKLVDEYYDQGKYEKAEDASRKAKLCSILGIVFFCLIVILIALSFV